MSFNDEDWKNVTSNLGPGDEVKIFVAFGQGYGLIVMETAVYLIYGQSITMEAESSTNIEMEASAEGNLQLSPEVKMEPSAEVNLQLSPEMKMEPSAEVNVQLSPEVKMEPLPKSNRSIFTRLGKRMGACLCLNQHRDKGLNNF